MCMCQSCTSSFCHVHCKHTISDGDEAFGAQTNARLQQHSRAYAGDDCDSGSTGVCTAPETQAGENLRASRYASLHYVCVYAYTETDMLTNSTNGRCSGPKQVEVCEVPERIPHFKRYY